jgi:hypothetical protein
MMGVRTPIRSPTVFHAVVRVTRTTVGAAVVTVVGDNYDSRLIGRRMCQFHLMHSSVTHKADEQARALIERVATGDARTGEAARQRFPEASCMVVGTFLNSYRARLPAQLLVAHFLLQASTNQCWSPLSRSILMPGSSGEDACGHLRCCK